MVLIGFSLENKIRNHCGHDERDTSDNHAPNDLCSSHAEAGQLTVKD